ncbi:Protein ltv1 [Saxophila tyrrhenica]|uniref:Protein ltv1 n=1 Tax=Saxophila tyrrhenica TaxID=1690608 RepID=A0AAV9P1L0_9PEZI|nr:Protein ltv1 [Saxophila tyrrhenica]
MPRRKFIDKKNATTFALVHRAGDDPLYHDQDAPSMVFAEKPTTQPKSLRRAREDDYAYSDVESVISSSQGERYRSNKVRERGDLEDEFGIAFKPNEGQAAQHGVFYDDTEYDYMQHMRELNGGGGGSVMWVEASAPPQAKRKQKLEDALRDIDLDGQSVGTADTSASKARSLLPEEVLPSEFVRKRNYQDQQDVPDDLAGFQPDMDPRLREVLEAMEDEEYVDDLDEDDIFGQLIGDGEVDEDEFEMFGEQMLVDEDEALTFDEDGGPANLDDDEGWESDDTIKAASPPPTTASETPSLQDLKSQGEMLHPPTEPQAQLPADPTAGAWLDEYKKFKSAPKPSETTPSTPLPPPAALSSAAAPSNVPSTRKSRKRGTGASTNFSMTSSTLSRTAHQRLLDARFDKLESDYSADRFPDDENDAASGLGSMASGVTGTSRMSAMSGMSRASTLSQVRESGPKSVRQDFDGMIDDFLSTTGSGKGAKRRGLRKGRVADEGLAGLDEVRQGLGPARVKGKSAAAG